MLAMSSNVISLAKRLSMNHSALPTGLVEPSRLDTLRPGPANCHLIEIALGALLAHLKTGTELDRTMGELEINDT
jgi:hypothetical protein